MARGFNNRNAYAGRNVELLFVNSVKDHPNVITKIQKSFNIDSEFVTAINTGIQDEKVDAKLEFASGRNIDANIKAFKDMGFNQITRTSITNFCELFNLNNEFKTNIEKLTVHKSTDTGSYWIPLDQQPYYKDILQPLAENIVRWSFSRNVSREILVLYSRNENLMHIYLMKDVFHKLNYDISYTSRGNILIGKHITIQRKGGNGVHSLSIPKNSLDHPGNNLQLKLHIHSFINDLKDIELCNYNI